MSKFYIGQKLILPAIYTNGLNGYTDLKQRYISQGYVIIESRRNCVKFHDKCDNCSGIAYKFLGVPEDGWCELWLELHAVSKPLIVKPKPFKISNNG